MREDPESVLQAAYAAMATADVVLLDALLDPTSVEHLHSSLVELLEKQRIQASDDADAARWYAHFLSRYNVRSPEEFRDLSRDALMEHLVHSHPPAMRTTLACHTLGHSVDDAAGLAEVRFLVHLGDPPQRLPGTRTATLRRLGAGWNLVTQPFNDWVVPGLENTFFEVDL